MTDFSNSATSQSADTPQNPGGQKGAIISFFFSFSEKKHTPHPYTPPGPTTANHKPPENLGIFAPFCPP
jgi:hypothetical protein